MFALIHNKLTDEYNTIYEKDVNDFLELRNFCQTDFKYEVIKNRKKIKEILEDKFTSKGRGEEYNEDLPSSTKIAYSLFPVDLYKDKFLIRWKNDTPLLEQDNNKEETLNKGTIVHSILEHYICDKEGRKKDKPIIEQLKILQKSKKPSLKIQQQIENKIINDIKKYAEESFNDSEILRKIPDIQETKDFYLDFALKCLPDFIKRELIFIDLVYSEIFISMDNFIQGSIDLVCYYNNKFSIWDYKTTSSVDKNTGKPKFKTKSQLAPYARQLYIYYKLLQNSGMTHLYGDGLPSFNIIQLHLISGEYKKFDIPQELVKKEGKTVDKVLQWYWAIRKDEDLPKDDIEEDYELLSL